MTRFGCVGCMPYLKNLHNSGHDKLNYVTVNHVSRFLFSSIKTVFFKKKGAWSHVLATTCSPSLIETSRGQWGEWGPSVLNTQLAENLKSQNSYMPKTCTFYPDLFFKFCILSSSWHQHFLQSSCSTIHMFNHSFDTWKFQCITLEPKILWKR